MTKKLINLLVAVALLMTAGFFSSTAIQVKAQTEITDASPANITTGAPVGCLTVKRPLDFDGDGKTDPTVVRNTGGGATGQITWFSNFSGGGTLGTAFGITGDRFVPADYDGDGKADIAVWRGGAQAYFFIMQSQTNTFRADEFGVTGDDPTVVGDYTGDGKADPAVYRGGATSGNPSFWYYRASSGALAGLIIGTQWGQNGDFPGPGDYDGDGRYDFVVQRSSGGGSATFFLNQTTAGLTSVVFGTPTDRIVPGDYDGDCKTDIAVARTSGGFVNWYIRNSTNSAVQSFSFGASASDFITQGDYDGDGRTDISVWRNSIGTFFWRRSLDGTAASLKWGQTSDYPPANFNTH